MTDPSYEPAWETFDRELSRCFFVDNLGLQRRRLRSRGPHAETVTIQYQTDHQGAASTNAFIRVRRAGRRDPLLEGYEAMFLLYCVTGRDELYVVKTVRLQQLLQEETLRVVQAPVEGALIALSSLERASEGMIRLPWGNPADSPVREIDILPGKHYRNRAFGYTVESIDGDEVRAVKDNGEHVVLSLKMQRRILTRMHGSPPRRRPRLTDEQCERLFRLLLG